MPQAQVIRALFNTLESSPKRFRHGFGNRYVVVECYVNNRTAEFDVEAMSDDEVAIHFAQSPQSMEVQVVIVG